MEELIILQVSTVKILIPHKIAVTKPITTYKAAPIKRSHIDNIDEVYERENIDKNEIVFNNAKYKTSLATTNVKVNEYIKFQVKNMKPTAKINNGQVLIVQKYAENFESKYSTGPYSVTIQNLPTINKQIKTYVFVEPQGDNKIYEYDFTLKLRQ